MRTVINVPASLGVRAVEAALEGLSQLATEEHRASRLPPLYKSGVRYRRENGTEDWLTPREVLAAGHADCEDLSAYRVGELRASGVDPAARIVIERTGPRTLHALVRRGDGQLEDPSRALGMTGRGAGAQLPSMIAGVEPEHTWVELRRRSPRGTLHSGPSIGDALAPELGFGPAVVPILDTVARAAQGAVSAVLPGVVAPPGGTGPQRVTQPTMPAARAVSAQLRSDGVDVSPGEVLQLAVQLARVVRAEAARQARGRR